MRTALFLDGKNFYSGWRDRTNRQQLDFVKLSQWLVAEAGGSRLWAAHYYTGIESGNEGETQGQQSLARFLDWLDEQPGFFVQRFPRRTRSITCEHCGDAVRYSEEKEVDTTLVADLVRLAAVGAYDVAVLVSGDGDFASALEAARSLGKQTYVATWGKSQLSNRLRRAAYHHLDLLDGLHIFGREPPASPATGAVGDDLPRVQAATSTTTGAPTPPAGAEVRDSVPPAIAEQDGSDLPVELQAFLDELKRAEAHFRERGGYLGANYFVSRWQSDHLPASTERCRELLRQLESLGRVEVYATPGGDLAVRSR